MFYQFLIIQCESFTTKLLCKQNNMPDSEDSVSEVVLLQYEPSVKLWTKVIQTPVLWVSRSIQFKTIDEKTVSNC